MTGVKCNICGKHIADDMNEPWHLHMLQHTPEDILLFGLAVGIARKMKP